MYAVVFREPVWTKPRCWAKQGNPGDWESLLAVSADHHEGIAPKLTEDEQ